MEFRKNTVDQAKQVQIKYGNPSREICFMRYIHWLYFSPHVPFRAEVATKRPLTRHVREPNIGSDQIEAVLRVLKKQQ